MAPILPPLYVNDGPLDPSTTGRLQPTTLDTPMDEMRHRLAKDGYLFLKGILPRHDVLQARNRYFQMLAPTGILKPNTDPVDGLFDTSKNPRDFPGVGAGTPNPGSETSNHFMDPALKAHAEEWYAKDLCQHPALVDFVSRFTGWGDSTWGLERTLLRNNVPTNPAIGVHYDYIFLRHGDDDVLTAWVPMGDISLEGGGLIYLEDGQTLGRQVELEFTEKAKASGMTDEEAKFAFNRNMMDGGVLTKGPRGFSDEHGMRWLVTEYEAGDVVLHSSYMIHASTINHDKSGAIRLGTDLRFVDKSKNWDSRWAKVFETDDGL